MSDELTSVGDFQTAELRYQLAMALAQKQQATAKAQGGAIVELLQAAARTGKAAGRGDQFDANV